MKPIEDAKDYFTETIDSCNEVLLLSIDDHTANRAVLPGLSEVVGSVSRQ